MSIGAVKSFVCMNGFSELRSGNCILFFQKAKHTVTLNSNFAVLSLVRQGGCKWLQVIITNAMLHPLLQKIIEISVCRMVGDVLENLGWNLGKLNEI